MSIQASERTEILKLLVLMFNAAPGAVYLSQVVAIYESLGKNLGALANALDDIQPYPTLNPNFQVAEEFAAAFLTPLGLQNDALSIDFVVSRFNANVPKGEIVYEAYLALQLVGAGGSASQYENAFAILLNKTAVAEYYSVEKGVSSTDFALLQLVLNGITADPDSVATALAEIDDGTRGTSGIEATLTPSQDTVVGTNASDTVNGLFGDATVGNNTYTAGDSIDLGAGTDRLNLVAVGSTASQAITVKNTESINIQDTVGATFNALLVENTPGISFTNTVKDQTSTVTNAALASVMGLQGAGNLTVDYASTSGKADAASVSLNAVGTSTSARSTVNVADGNTVEKITVAATGANFVTLTGGTAAASLVITGDGTNNFALSAADSLAAVTSIDASTSTGTNTFAMGGNLNTGTTIKGGTGKDTVSTTLSSPTLVGPTLAGVETLSTTFTAGAVVDLGSATGLTAVTASASTAAMTFQNAPSSVASLTVSSMGETKGDVPVNFAYDPTSKGNLVLNIGSATAAVDVGLVTLSGTTSVTINTVGALPHNASGINIAGHQTGLTLNTAAGSNFGWGTLTVKGDVDSYISSMGTNSSFSGYTTILGDLDSMSVNVAAGADRTEQLRAENIGDVTISATGNDTSTQELIFALGDIGSINATLLGDSGRMAVGAFSSGGTIGDINVALTGDDSRGQMFAFAIHSGGDAAQDIGNVSIAINGDNTGFSGYAVAFGGDVGTLSLTVTGADSHGQLGAEAIYATDAFVTAQFLGKGAYAFGGNVGDITLTVNGTDANGSIAAVAVGGNIGDVTVSIQGDGAGGGVQLRALQTSSSGAPNSDIGDVSVTVANTGSFSGYFTAIGGDIGDITVDVGNDASVDLYMTLDGGEIGTTDITAGDGTTVRLNYEAAGSGSGGSGSGAGFLNSFQSDPSVALAPISGGTTTVGAIVATFGDDGHLGVNVSGHYDFGDITATFGDNGSFSGYWVTSVSGGFIDPNVIGDINMTFGDDGSFGVTMAFGTHVDVGDISVAFGDGGDFDLHQYSGSYGNVGDIFVTFGDNGSFNFNVVSGGGSGLSIGDISLTFGSNASVDISIQPNFGANYASIGMVSLTGGDAGSDANIDLGASGLSIDIMGGVDASAWLGYVNVDLASVQLGTTVRVGADGSWVRGTEGADNIFLAAGYDVVQFDTTPTATDVIFSFTAGAGKDALLVPAGATSLKAVMTADAAATAVSGDVHRLVDIAGGQDITTAAGLVTALETGEYASVSQTAGNHFTIVTAASSTASAIYVFDVTDDGDAIFETGEVVLVGVVNISGAGAIGTLVIGNFQSAL